MLSAQQSRTGPSWPGRERFEERYTELKELRPVPDRVAKVHHLLLKRDVGQFTLESGTLYLLAPVAGRTVGAVFLGKGVFSFSPPTRIEQERLKRFEKAGALATAFTDVVFLFADSTLSELERHLSFTSGTVPGEIRGRVANAFKYLGDDGSRTFDPDLMTAFLNRDVLAEVKMVDWKQ
jgi:hypothetical protein